MASLFHKISAFLRTPQGRKAMSQAKRYASDPRRQQQAKDALKKIRGGKGGGTGGSSSGPQPPAGPTSGH